MENNSPDPPKSPPENLQELLNLLREVPDEGNCVTIGEMLDAIGRRSFGPILLFCGLIAITPLSGIPGVPTTVATIVLLVAGQLLFRRDHFWIPSWIEKRTISRRKFEQALRFLQRPAGAIDSVLRPRLVGLAQGMGVYVVGLVCSGVAMTMPPLEPLPFAASTAGAAIAVFGLALVTRDGLLVLFGFALAGGIFCLLVNQLL